MLSLEYIQEVIKQRIVELDLAKNPAELYDPIRYTLSLGGKRLRPALCLIACDSFNGDLKRALDPAVGIEIFHNFTLLHDDIMDEAPIRRGKPTVHKKWNRNVAILSGDTMMALAYEYILKAPEEIRTNVFSVFNKTAIEVCEGQQYDMTFEAQSSVSINEYIAMIRLKTAVLIAASLKIGALIGGASVQAADQLYSFGENIGIAFQLKDDLLDAFSDENKFGKTHGGDIISNKKTFLYIKAFEIAKGKNLEELTRLYSKSMCDANEKIEEVIRIYEKLNIRQLADNEIKTYSQKALTILENLDINMPHKSILKNIAGQLDSRKY